MHQELKYQKIRFWSMKEIPVGGGWGGGVGGWGTPPIPNISPSTFLSNAQNTSP